MSKEARFLSAAIIVAALFSTGASYRTQNFIVSASTAQLAREICEKAESDRKRLAIEWLGHELPTWRGPCPITAQVSPGLGAGGATSFMFDRGRPYGWTMSIQGSRERVLDSVLPHEVTHTIFATHFGRPLPRWADEGACTTVEHTSERTKQERLLIQFLMTQRGIAFNRMFAMKEYPRDVLPLYAQGYSLARYLIAQGGKRKFVDYVGDGMNSNNWPAATRKHYGFKDLSDLQVTWLDWVRGGSKEIQGESSQGAILLANNQTKQTPISKLASFDSTSEPQKEQLVGLSNVSEPPVEQVASAVTHRSWYLEQRDLAQAKKATVPDATTPFTQAPPLQQRNPTNFTNSVAPIAQPIQPPTQQVPTQQVPTQRPPVYFDSPIGLPSSVSR